VLTGRYVEEESNPIVSVRDWAIGSTLSYANGTPILAPTSTNNLTTLLFRSTFFNRVPGVSLFLKDLNCHCIDPTQDLVLNLLAWSNPSATSPTAPTTKNASNGFLTGGYGFVNYVGGGTFVPPRPGTLEMRSSF
jgi:hypothetical protein